MRAQALSAPTAFVWGEGIRIQYQEVASGAPVSPALVLTPLLTKEHI